MTREYLRDQQPEIVEDEEYSPRRSPGKKTLTSRLSPVIPLEHDQPAIQAKAAETKLRSTAEWTDSIMMNAALGYSPDQRPAPDLSSSGSGHPMPSAVQAKMERAFNADFSGVRIHHGPQAESIGARAFTRGTDIHFAPGEYDPGSVAGQELIGHELAHVVQQATGRVPSSVQGKGGVGINSDPGLEAEADEQGARAARGESATGQGGNAELTREQLEQLYPAEHVAPVAIGTLQSNVVQPAYTAKRQLQDLPFMFGPLYHEHIFFEDGGTPPDIGHMGPRGLGQDTSGLPFTRLLTGLDDALMRQAVAAVGNPGAYNLITNNCQHYVSRVMQQYRRLVGARRGGSGNTMAPSRGGGGGGSSSSQ